MLTLEPRFTADKDVGILEIDTHTDITNATKLAFDEQGEENYQKKSFRVFLNQMKSLTKARQKLTLCLESGEFFFETKQPIENWDIPNFTGQDPRFGAPGCSGGCWTVLYNTFCIPIGVLRSRPGVDPEAVALEPLLHQLTAKFKISLPSQAFRDE